eukprot:TRINITY_DN18322_c0_g1_i1.p1 TRINITY_DN18322_c0_g1~~TRINITY_DN18322_c0_g1_i1.p1  ORF type:complete len:339 (+),score=37.08 TRINITY_DN18322_c0_g1_i1:46-1017(+)
MMMSTEAVTVMVILNVIVAIPGMYEWQFTDGGKERESVVENYNMAVNMWQSVNLEEWEHIHQISIYDWSPTGGDQHVVLSPTDDEEDTEKSEGTTNYSPLRYTNSNSLGTQNATLAPTWKLLNSSLTFTTAAQSLHRPLLSLPINKVRVHNTSNWKQCQHTLKGSVHGRQCITYDIISYLCVLFEHREQPGGAGLRWVVAGSCGTSYTPVKVARYDGVPSAVTLPNDLRIVARHVMDPYLVAHTVTNGTLKFGRSPSDRHAIITLSATLTFSICIVFICINLYLYFTPNVSSVRSTEGIRQSICIDKPVFETSLKKRSHRRAT